MQFRPEVGDWKEGGEVVDFHLTVGAKNVLVLGKGRYDLTTGPDDRPIYVRVGVVHKDGSVEVDDDLGNVGREIMLANQTREMKLAKKRADDAERARVDALWDPNER